MKCAWALGAVGVYKSSESSPAIKSLALARSHLLLAKKRVADFQSFLSKACSSSKNDAGVVILKQNTVGRRTKAVS